MPIIPTVLCVCVCGGGGGGGGNLGLLAIRGVDKTWTAAREAGSVWVTIALADWNSFHPHWNVNCPFPFPSDQEGMIRLTVDQLYYQHRVSKHP